MYSLISVSVEYRRLFVSECLDGVFKVICRHEIYSKVKFLAEGSLIPIQLGEAEAQPSFSPSVEEVNEYYEQQENLDLGMYLIQHEIYRRECW